MPDKMIDLAYTKAEMKEEEKEGCCGPSGQIDPYPWGLNLRFEGRELDLLGIKALPGVGDEFHMTVIAKVRSVEQMATSDEDDRRCVGLQVIMAEVLAHETAEHEAKERKEYGPETAASESKEQKSIMDKYRS